MNIIIVIAIICIAILFILEAKSPYGYQDKTGFHYGHPPKDTEVDD